MKTKKLFEGNLGSDTTSVHRIGIASEAVGSGATAIYTACLDKSMRDCLGNNRVIETPEFIRTTGCTSSWKRNPILVQLNNINLLRKFVSQVRGLTPKVTWRDAETWAQNWRNISGDVICLIPHVNQNDEGELDSYYAALAERRFVWVIHDLHPYHFPDQWRKIDLETMHHRYCMLGERAARIIVHNEFTRGDVSKKLSISKERISVVRLPAFFSEEVKVTTEEEDDLILARFKLFRPYALWASSSTSAHKNHECLFKAWRILINRGHRLQLVCTGSIHPRWKQISKCIQDLSLSKFVRFTNAVNDGELAAILRNAHMAVCPTLFEGGGPVPAAEAVMAGIPLAVSDIPQAQQLFDGRLELATFFNATQPQAIADALEDILHHYSRAKERAIWARSEYSVMRTWKTAAQEYWNAIELAARDK